MSCRNIHFIGEGRAGNAEDAGFVHRGETFLAGQVLLLLVGVW
jgi:hypothetical protein